MSSDRRLALDISSPAARDGQISGLAPGRATLTSRHVMRAASGGAGAGDDAARRVELASSDPGHALPAELQERFEASLGTGLGGVRVHTGALSQDAAHAVGARAYAIGNDIHFGAGHYDPGSEPGQILIAHEVAHTVQQSGSAPQRQHKLAISGPQDAAELEADRAASAMVSGAPARVSPIASVIARDPAPAPSEVPLIEADTLKPFDWDAAAAPNPVEPTAAWSSHPVYADVQSSDKINVDGARQVFTLCWINAHGAYQNLRALVEKYKAQEAGLGGFPKDVLLHNTEKKTEVEQAEVSGMFKGDTIQTKKMDTSKLDDTERAALVTQRLTLRKADDDVRDAMVACDGFVTTIENEGRACESAVRRAKIKDLEKKVAGHEAAEKDVEMKRERAARKVEAATSLAKGLVKGATAIATEKPELGADAVGDLLEAAGKTMGGSLDETYTAQLRKLSNETKEIKESIADLEAECEMADAKTHAANAALAGEQLAAAREKYKTALQAKSTAHAAYAAFLRPLAEKAMGNKDDAKMLAGSYEAETAIAEIIQTCDTLIMKTHPPPYSELSGYGAAICTNRDEFVAHVGTLKGYRIKMNGFKAHWVARLASAGKVKPI